MFLFKVHINVHLFKPSKGLDAVHGIPRKPCDGFGNDYVDPASLTVFQHSQELFSLLQFCTAPCFSCIDSGKLSISMTFDKILVIVHLNLERIMLFTGIRVDSAVSANLFFCCNCCVTFCLTGRIILIFFAISFSPRLFSFLLLATHITTQFLGKLVLLCIYL